VTWSRRSTADGRRQVSENSGWLSQKIGAKENNVTEERCHRKQCHRRQVPQRTGVTEMMNVTEVRCHRKQCHRR